MAAKYRVLLPKWTPNDAEIGVTIEGLKPAQAFAEQMRCLTGPRVRGELPPQRWRKERGSVPGYSGSWPLTGRYVLEVGYKSSVRRGLLWLPVARVIREDCLRKDVP